MVGIGDADVGCGPGGDIGDHVVVDLSIVCIQPQVYRDIGIQGLEILNGLFVNVRLTLVGVIFGPEGDLICFCFIKGLRRLEGLRFPGAVAAGQENGTGRAQKKGKKPICAS